MLKNGADASLVVENKIIKNAFKSIEHDKMVKKLDKIGELIKEIYGSKPKDGIDTLKIIKGIIKYSPDNTKKMDKLEKRFNKANQVPTVRKRSKSF